MVPSVPRTCIHASARKTHSIIASCYQQGIDADDPTPRRSTPKRCGTYRIQAPSWRQRIIVTSGNMLCKIFSMEIHLRSFVKEPANDAFLEPAIVPTLSRFAEFQRANPTRQSIGTQDLRAVIGHTVIHALKMKSLRNRVISSPGRYHRSL
ncbi:hypothetical protein DENSPDRAFT_281907 [Dentipellis sp. KUC8613]|nr:hypothetical protein DENSPDRAFT_281907 [Dentipellis sp. KUC8613]